jgi:hypothetical protein
VVRVSTASEAILQYYDATSADRISKCGKLIIFISWPFKIMTDEFIQHLIVGSKERS